MIKFDKEKVLLLQKLIIESTGGSLGILNEKMLESALENVYQTFEGKELYQTKEQKAARLCFSLISNHAFIDGNKRIGILVMLSFLEITGIKLKYTNDDLVKLGLGVASGQLLYEDILQWINEHKIETLI